MLANRIQQHRKRTLFQGFQDWSSIWKSISIVMAGTIRNTIIEAYSLQYVQTQSVSVLVKTMCKNALVEET